MGKLQDWVDEEWVRIDSSGNIAGACGTSKNKKNPDRCLPKAKAKNLSKEQRASTARKKKNIVNQEHRYFITSTILLTIFAG